MTGAPELNEEFLILTFPLFESDQLAPNPGPHIRTAGAEVQVAWVRERVNAATEPKPTLPLNAAAPQAGR